MYGTGVVSQGGRMEGRVEGDGREEE